jgi:hypothetical protein
MLKSILHIAVSLFDKVNSDCCCMVDSRDVQIGLRNLYENCLLWHAEAYTTANNQQ